MTSPEPFITGLLVERTETTRRGAVALDYILTFEYADREPVTVPTKDVIWLDKVLEELGVPGSAATHILQRGGYVARVQVPTS